MAVLVYKALNDLYPQYPADDCQLTAVTGHCGLQTSNVATCEVPTICTSLVSGSFAVAGPLLWATTCLLPT